MSIVEASAAFPGLVLDFALRALLLGLVFASALRVLRVQDTAVAYGTWRVALVAMLLLPLGSMVVPGLRVLPFSAVGVSSHISQAQPVSQGAQTSIRSQAPGRVVPAVPSQSTRRGFSWTLAAFGAYLLITGLMLARVVIGGMVLHRTARRMKLVDDWRLIDRVSRQCGNLGLAAFPELRCASSVTVPVTFGWRIPTILLPGDWTAWPTEKLDFVLAHELSHVQRRDYLFRVLSAVNKALYWFHPLSWWLDKRVVELSEHLSDDAALHISSGDRDQYAGILQEFTNALTRHSRRLHLGIAMSAPGRASRRITRILDRNRVLTAGLSLRQKVAIYSATVPALLLIVGAQTADRPATPEPAQAGPGAGITQFATPNTAKRASRVPPPMFSPAYVEALRDVLELEPDDAALLEARLVNNPDDFAARLKLIAYHARADRVALRDSRNRRAELVLWLIENRPDSEILSSPYTTLSSADLTSDQSQRASRSWETAIRDRPQDARVMWNAANFYRELDRSLYLAALEKAVALAPDYENYARPLGLLYAGAILGGDPALAQRAIRTLDSTPSAFLLEPAVKLLQSEYNASQMRGKKNAAVGELARRYFERANALDPGVDEAWIFPKLDPKMAGILIPGARPPESDRQTFETAATQILRLSPDAFPNLPEPIKSSLRLRGCLIPQPADSREPQGAIQGEFVTRGQPSWAVLCSLNGVSSIFVFRDAADASPAELARVEDKNYLQGLGEGRVGYSRAIQTVDRKYIMTHYRAYGGPQPPPIDHHGIDDIFLGKASVTHYWHEGQWLQLQGAD